MEYIVHKPYKIDDMKKGKRKYLSKGDKRMNKNTGMWTNSLDMELWAKVPRVKVLAPTNSWTLPLTMYKRTHLLWINLANVKGLKMKLEILP
jgi:hypothetical protein